MMFFTPGTAAFPISADVVARTWADRFVPLLDSVGVYRDGGEPPVVEDDELDIDIVLSGELLDRKMRAIYEHKSQLEGLVAVFGHELLSVALASESFRRASTASEVSR